MVKEKLVKKKCVSVYLDPAFQAKLEFYCYRKNISRNHIIAQCLERHLKEDYYDKDIEFTNMMKEGWNVKK